MSREEQPLSEDDDDVGDNVTPAWHRRVLRMAEDGDYRGLRKALRDADLVTITDVDGYTPLHRASRGNHCDAIRLLIEKGSNPNARTRDGWTPLHCACHWHNVEAAALLIENGADINALTNGNVTPLHLAASGQNKRLMELLLYNDEIDLTVRNNAGDTAYEIASRNGPLYKLFRNV